MRNRRRPPPCSSLGLPHGLMRARPYVLGWRCELHTPAAEKGRPESPPGPGWPIHRQQLDPETPSPDGQEMPS
ncbi:hypothetical protein FEF34_24825 [Streptomyces marianii]|uniref:Uncharacterized protein n=1 Tax=Streptomyces marianii TaxID=1817406 RepID=A0A5R9EAB2_9ACTN|nr:hypothetical protein FEF34_24825 [Streptomyces marianii]